MRRSLVLVALLLLTAVSVWGIEAPIVSIPEVSSAPSIDGQLSSDEWKSAAVICGFREYTSGHPASGKTVVSLCYDNSALYVLFQNYGEDDSMLLGTVGDRDSAVWNDSEVETFIMPPKWNGKYAHLMMNHAGTIADEKDSGSYDSSWNPEWKRAVGKSAGIWFGEIAIPWSSLDIDPSQGMTFKANFSRNLPKNNELSSWAPVSGTFHQPKYFGTIILAGKSQAVAVPEIPDKQTGQYNIKPTLLGNPNQYVNVMYMPVTVQGASKIKSTSGRVGPGESFPINLGYGLKEMTIKITGENKKTLWQQSVLLDIPGIPDRIASLQKINDNLLKKNVLSEVEAGELTSLLSSIRTTSLGQNGPDSIKAMAAKLDTIECRLSDLTRLACVKKKSKNMVVASSYYVTNPVSTLKIQQNTTDPGPLANKLRIAMAKAEYEASQIVVCPVKQDLKGTLVTVSALSSVSGHVIPAERIQVTPIASVNCISSTGGSRLRGLVPDVLLPNRKMDIASGIRQPYFITVQTAADDPAETYSGTVLISSDNAESTVLPLSVRVYNVTLPVKSKMRTAFVLWGSFRSFMSENTHANFIDAYIRYSKTMLSYRISPITMWSPEKNADGEWNFADYDKYCFAVVPFGLTTLNIGGNGELVATKNTDYAKAASVHFKSKGWWNLHYVYGQDEAPASAENTLVTNYKAVVDAVPDIKIMQTGWSPAEKLKNLVKIWCPLTASADLESCYAAQKAGDEVWWYVCCGPTAPYANLFVDYPGIDHRMLGWMTYKYKITGLLYWGVDVWPDNNDSVDSYNKSNYADWKPRSFGSFNGDGYLLYPGLGDSPVASMRLALLRDGIEDYDLFKAAEELAATRSKPGSSINRLLNIDNKLIKSLTEFSQKGEDLLKHREKLLQACEKSNL